VTYTAQPHSFRALKGLGWPVCSSCGLVRLRNALTDWCVRNGCNHEDHPGYKSAVAKSGGA
jgi:hypothetical protein